MVQILYICDTLKQRSGVTAVVTNYIGHIDLERIKIDIVAYSDSEPQILEYMSEKNIKIYFMPKLGVNNFFEFIKFYERLFKTNTYQIIHSHFCQIDSIVFSIAKKYGIKNLISHSHNTKYSEYRIKALRNYFLCISLKRKATVWGACSIAAGEFLYGKKFLKSPKAYLIRNGVDCKKFTYNETVRNRMRSELGVTSEILIGNIGSCKPQKNQEFLLEIIKRLKKENASYRYKLLIVGDGELKEKLIEKSKSLCVFDDCLFVGVRTDIPALLQAMDVFLLPSLYEGLPVVGIEAQAAGIPCFFSDTITREACINNVEYLSIHDPNEWADRISNSHKKRDMCSAKKMMESGYDISDGAKKLCEFYERIANE